MLFHLFLFNVKSRLSEWRDPRSLIDLVWHLKQGGVR
jgi:hypothetical protein